MLRMLPNILTASRVVLAIIFLAMLIYYPAANDKTSYIDIAFVLFIITGVTDVIDGPIARKLNVTSKFGRIFDPLADKLLVCGSFICFAILNEPKLFGWSPQVLKIIHWFVAGIIIAREVYVTVIRQVAEQRGINFAATASGKIKMLVQSFAIGTVLVKIAHVPTATWGYWFTTVVLIITVAITIFSGIRSTQRISRT